MAGLKGVFFDTSVLISGMIEFGRNSYHALLLMDAVADGRIECPLTAWPCCLEFYSVTTRLPEEYRCASWNSLLCWLREAEAWGQAAGAVG